jgi:hypothetical protein
MTQFYLEILAERDHLEAMNFDEQNIQMVFEI